MVKVYSSVADYGRSYELLQFTFDRWLYKTVTGMLLQQL